jgi:hypothetical protein
MPFGSDQHPFLSPLHHNSHIRFCFTTLTGWPTTPILLPPLTSRAV